MVYDELIQKFMNFIEKKYPEPKCYWTDIHYQKRCFERFGLERVVIKCLDNPFTNPIYILETDIMYWQELAMKCTNATHKTSFKYIYNALNELWDIVY